MSRADLSEVRKRAWETRRARYGNRGHRGAYLTGRNCPRCVSMEAVLIRLHAEGVLSEGQVSKATDLGRVEIRRRIDRVRNQRRTEGSLEMSDVEQGRGSEA